MPDYDSWSDQQLVDACNAGDARAFEAIYRRYRDWSVRVAYRFCGDSGEALDVMQEAFVYLLSRFPGFRLSSRLTSYLYVVIKHGAMSSHRRARRGGVGADIPEFVTAAGEGADGLDARESRAELGAALERLSDVHREVLLMRFVDGMSLQEIAAALNTPLGTVKSRLHHALGGLRADPRTARYFEEGR